MRALVDVDGGMHERARAHVCRPTDCTHEDSSDRTQLTGESRAVAEARVGAVDDGERRRHKLGQLGHEELAQKLCGGVAVKVVPAGLVIKGLQEWLLPLLAEPGPRGRVGGHDDDASRGGLGRTGSGLGPLEDAQKEKH